MPAARSLLAGFVAMSLLRVGSAVLAFLFVLYLGRERGPGPLGTYSLVTSVFLMLQFVPLMGLHTVLTRDAAARPDHSGSMLLAGQVLAQPVALLLLAASTGAQFALPGHEPDVLRGLWYMAVALVPTAFTTAVEAILVGRERTDIVAVNGLVENTARAVAGIAVLRTGYGLEALFAVFAAGRFAAAGAYLCRRDVRAMVMSRRPDAAHIRGLATQVPVFFAIMALAALLERLDFLVLGWSASLEEVGVYAASYKLYELMLMVPRILSLLLLPRFAACLRRDAGMLPDAFLATLRLGLAGGVPAVLLVVWLAGPLMEIYGSAYRGGGPVLALLAATVVCVAVSNLYSVVLIVTANQRRDLAILATTVALYAVALLALVPAFGAIGAAGATLGAAAFQAGIALLVLGDRLERRPAARAVLVHGLAAAMAVATFVAVSGFGATLAPLAAFMVFALTVAAARGASRGDLETARRTLTSA